MAINRYSKRTPYQGSLYELPVEFIAKTLENTQKRYDENKEIADTIQDFTIPSLAQDRQRANALQKQYSDAVDATVAEYSGNYAKASSKLKELTRKIKKDFNPGGEAAAISGNYTNYNTWLKSSLELVEKGKVLGEDFNLANAYHMKNYQGIGSFDPVKGSYNIFNPETLSEYGDMEGNIQKSFATFKPEKSKHGTTQFKNGNIIYHETEYEGISKARLKPSFESALNTDPKITNYISQRAKYLGYSPKEAQDYINNFAAQRANDLAYQNSSDIEKVTRDPLSLLYARAKIAADAKKVDENTTYNPWATLSSEALPFRKQSNLDANDWRNTPGLSNPSPETNSVGGMVSTSNYANWLTGSLDPSNKKPLKEVLFTSNFISKTHVDPMLAKAVWSHLSSKNARAYVDNYGKPGKETWTEEFDRQFIYAYQAREKDHVFVEPSYREIPQRAARVGIMSDIIGKLRYPENVMVMKVGSGEVMTAKEAQLSQKDFQDDKGKHLTNDVSIAIPGQAIGGLGHLVPTPKGSYIFLDNNQEVTRKTLPLTHAAKNLFFEGKEQTDAPIDMVINGQQLNGFMRRTIIADDNGVTHEVLYGVPVKLDKSGHPITNRNGSYQAEDYNNIDPKKYLVNWRDTQDLYIRDALQGLNGTRQTKAETTFFDMYLNSMQQQNQQTEQDYNDIIDQAALNQEQQ